jgi:hypothetical protein
MALSKELVGSIGVRDPAIFYAAEAETAMNPAECLPANGKGAPSAGVRRTGRKCQISR